MDIASPQLPKKLDEVTGLRQLIQCDETMTGILVRDEDISGFRCKGFSAAEAQLERITATHASLEKTSFKDIVIINCDMIATLFADSSWLRATIKNSRCDGMQLHNSTLKDITFTDSKLSLANFRFSKLKNICFKNCVLDEVDFYMAELDHVYFEDCTLAKPQFSSSKLKNVDLRTSTITNVSGLGNLRGAVIDSTQLVSLGPELANEMGITIKDE